MKKRSVWDILVYVALAVLLIWIILKIAGVFDTLIIVEAIPYISVGYVVGRMFQKLETTESNVKNINGEMKDIKIEVRSIDKRIHTLEIKNGFKKKKEVI